MTRAARDRRRNGRAIQLPNPKPSMMAKTTATTPDTSSTPNSPRRDATASPTGRVIITSPRSDPKENGAAATTIVVPISSTAITRAAAPFSARVAARG
ncbi:MAG: hypothetical protein BWY79_01764 [Actinobacteria bacterium ADurb.Bin444]|nr:MAG: hypothetical protein BWY79_01764 [Actinobacteria bacterium ADurb.Bin444]